MQTKPTIASDNTTNALQQPKYRNIAHVNDCTTHPHKPTHMVVPLFQEMIKNENDSKSNEVGKDISDYDINKIIATTKIFQKHPKYVLMKQCNQELMANELLALIYYLDPNSCYKLNNQSYESWKHLNFHVSNAVAKMHRVFHHKNNKELPKMLFHINSTQQPFFHKLSIYKTRLSVDSSFSSGSILIISKVDEQLRSGLSQGADVSWLTSYTKDQAEFIILPTICYKWRRMSKQEICDHGWKIKDNIKVYITYDCVSNNNLLVVSNIANECRYIKDWFDTELGLRKVDSIKYFELFVNNGYNTFDSIKEIKCFGDLNKIGISKIGHVKKIVKKIKLLDKYVNRMEKLKVNNRSLHKEKEEKEKQQNENE